MARYLAFFPVFALIFSQLLLGTVYGQDKRPNVTFAGESMLLE